jgi:hypothetical protein
MPFRLPSAASGLWSFDPVQAHRPRWQGVRPPDSERGTNPQSPGTARTALPTTGPSETRSRRPSQGDRTAGRARSISPSQTHFHEHDHRPPPPDHPVRSHQPGVPPPSCGAGPPGRSLLLPEGTARPPSRPRSQLGGTARPALSTAAAPPGCVGAGRSFPPLLMAASLCVPASTRAGDTSQDHSSRALARRPTQARPGPRPMGEAARMPRQGC